MEEKEMYGYVRVSIKEQNLIGTLISDLILALLSYVAESEYKLIHQRQAEGIAAAKARGVKFGRPPHKLPDNFEEQYWKWKRKEIKLDEAAKACGMARTTFYEKARKYGENRGEKGEFGKV